MALSRKCIVSLLQSALLQSAPWQITQFIPSFREMFPVANLYWPLFVIYLPPEFTWSHIIVHDQISMNSLFNQFQISTSVWNKFRNLNLLKSYHYHLNTSTLCPLIINHLSQSLQYYYLYHLYSLSSTIFYHIWHLPPPKGCHLPPHHHFYSELFRDLQITLWRRSIALWHVAFSTTLENS